MKGYHTCQLSQIMWESPAYRNETKNLKILTVFILILANFGGNFEIFDSFLGVNWQCSNFNSILRIEMKYLDPKLTVSLADCNPP